MMAFFGISLGIILFAGFVIGVALALNAIHEKIIGEDHE
jgi:hypothetical protein